MVIVWRLTGKIIGTVLCCIVYDGYAHTFEQFLNLHFGLDFIFVCLFV